MPRDIEFVLKGWTALSPNASSLQEWKEWARSGACLGETSAKPKARFIAAGLRRRCSALARLAMASAHACVDDNVIPSVQTVFASRYGEGIVTRSLLESLAVNEPLSPNKFSLSVHNTSSGLFSIVFENRAASTSIAGGEDTLIAGLIESYAALQSAAEEKQVLCIIAEEPLPELFRTSAEETYPLFAIALLLASANDEKGSFDDKGSLRMKLTRREPTDPRGKVSDSVQANHFLRWMFTDGLQPLVLGCSESWELSRSNEETSVWYSAAEDREFPHGDN